MNIICKITTIFHLFIICGKVVGQEECKNVLHVFVIYDESVCKTEDPCEEFKQQIELMKSIALNPQFQTFSQVLTCLNSGPYTRYVIRKFQRLNINDILDDAVKDYIMSPPNLAGALALILTEIYRHGIFNEGGNQINWVLILTGTEFQNTEIVQELLAEIFKFSGFIFAVGVGNNVQENVLKNISSKSQEIKENYLTEMNPDLITNVIEEQFDSICGNETPDEPKGQATGKAVSAGDIADGLSTKDETESTTDPDDGVTFSITGEVHEYIDEVNTSPTFEVTRSRLEGDLLGPFGSIYNLLGMLLLLLLILLLIFGAVYCSSSKTKVPPEEEPPEEEDEEEEIPDSQQIDIAPSRSRV